MNWKLNSRWMLILLLGMACPLPDTQSFAQGTTVFTYQGQLRDGGTNANGTYTMVFKLYDAVSGGNQIGGTVTNSPTLANGLFTVNLDFGAGVFDGNSRWLDITVRAGAGTPETLAPRVQVLPAPYALYATSANAITLGITNLIGSNVVSVDYWNAGVPVDPSHDFVFADNSVAQMVVHPNGQGVSFAGNVSSIATFHGDGSGLTNISAIPNMRVFDTPGTNQFVVPTDITRVMVELWGGGGGGGSAISFGWGPGGGGGGYGKGIFSVIPNTTNQITVGYGGASDGRGGSSSFDNRITAEGGSNLVGADYLNAPIGGQGGGSDGPVNIMGGSGSCYRNISTSVKNGGDGGNAACGGSGGNGDGGAGAEAGKVPGGGGGGGRMIFNMTNAVPGAPGGHGRVVVTW